MILKNIFSNWFGLLVFGLLSFILTPILIHGLGQFYFGLWMLVSSVISYYGLLDMGLRMTTQRYVARFHGSNDRQALDETFTTTLGLTLAVSLLLLILAGGLVFVLPQFFKLHGADAATFRALILITALDVAVSLPQRLLTTYLCGFQRFDLYNLVGIAFQVARTILIVIVLRAGFGVMGVALAQLGLGITAVPCVSALVRRVDPGLHVHWRRFSLARAREVVNFSFYIFLNTTGEQLRSYTDSLVIGRILGVVMVAPFTVAARLLEYFKQLMTGVIGPLMPAISSLDAQGRDGEVRSLFLRASRVTGLLSVFVSGLLLFNGKDVLRFWVGENFVGSYSLLAILVVGYLVSMAQAPSTVLLIARGAHKPMGWWNIAEGVANLVLSIYWARRYGLAGVALGTTVPMLATKLLIQPWYVLRVMRMSLWEYASGALLRPAIVAVMLGFAYQGTALVFPVAGVGSLLLKMAAQAGIFAAVTYTVGFAASDREIVWSRGKGLALQLGLSAKPKLG